MPNRNAGTKAAPARKLKKEQTQLAQQVSPQGETQSGTGDINARLQLEKGISELQLLHKLLLSAKVDPDVLADFLNALNQVRNAAWAAHQYVAHKDSDHGSNDVYSLLVGARIRAVYQNCRSLDDDLKRTDIEFQRGSLIELYETTKILTETLKGVIGKS
jgi:hypothetical protein